MVVSGKLISDKLSVAKNSANIIQAKLHSAKISWNQLSQSTTISNPFK